MASTETWLQVALSTVFGLDVCPRLDDVLSLDEEPPAEMPGKRSIAEDHLDRRHEPRGTSVGAIPHDMNWARMYYDVMSTESDETPNADWNAEILDFLEARRPQCRQNPLTTCTYHPDTSQALPYLYGNSSGTGFKVDGNPAVDLDHLREHYDPRAHPVHSWLCTDTLARGARYGASFRGKIGQVRCLVTLYNLRPTTLPIIFRSVVQHGERHTQDCLAGFIGRLLLGRPLCLPAMAPLDVCHSTLDLRKLVSAVRTPWVVLAMLTGAEIAPDLDGPQPALDAEATARATLFRYFGASDRVLMYLHSNPGDTDLDLDTLNWKTENTAKLYNTLMGRDNTLRYLFSIVQLNGQHVAAAIYDLRDDVAHVCFDIVILNTTMTRAYKRLVSHFYAAHRRPVQAVHFHYMMDLPPTEFLARFMEVGDLDTMIELHKRTRQQREAVARAEARARPVSMEDEPTSITAQSFDLVPAPPQTNPLYDEERVASNDPAPELEPEPEPRPARDPRVGRDDLQDARLAFVREMMDELPPARALASPDQMHLPEWRRRVDPLDEELWEQRRDEILHKHNFL